MSGFNISFVGGISPFIWVFLIAICVTAYLLGRYDRRLSLGLATVVSIFFLWLPSWTTNRIYGPDSYQKLGDALYTIQTRHIPAGDIYPGAKAVAAIIHQFAPSLPVTGFGLKLIAALTGPVSCFYLGQVLSLDSREQRAFAVIGAYAPLGFGVWLTTRSIYHPFFLSIPLGILFVATAMRVVKTKNVQTLTVAAVFGVALTTIHPLTSIVFLSTIPFLFLCIGDLIDLRELVARTKIFSVLVSSNVILLIFQLRSKLRSLVGRYLQIDTSPPTSSQASAGTGAETSSGSTTANTGGTNAFPNDVEPATAAVTKCIPSSASEVPLCTIHESVGLFIGTIIIGGVGIGVAATLLFSQLLDGREITQEILMYGSGLGYIGAALLFIVLAPVNRILAFRVLPAAILVALVMLGMAAKSARTTRLPAIVFVCLVGTIGVATGAFLYTLGVSAGATMAGISAVGVLAAALTTRSLSVQHGVVAAVLLLVLVTPVLFPWAGVNAVPNQPGTAQQEGSVKWLDKYGVDYKIAANPMLQRIDYYQDAGRMSSQYVGSTWLFELYVLHTDEHSIQTDYTATGQPVAPTSCLYVAISPFDTEFVPVAYVENGVGKKEARTLTLDKFERIASGENRVYDAGGRHTVYLHCES